eukprot:scaffold1736_cov127-Cylindrotheca_fusiformis.AAC.81
MHFVGFDSLRVLKYQDHSSHSQQSRSASFARQFRAAPPPVFIGFGRTSKPWDDDRKTENPSTSFTFSQTSQFVDRRLKNLLPKRMNIASQGITRHLLLYSTLYKFQRPTMNLRSIALLGALVKPSSAWLSRPGAGVESSLYRIQNSIGFRSFTASTLQSTMVPEDVDVPTPLRPKGKTIAEGTLVSMFKGGLLAVRIDDEFVEAIETPEVIDATKILPKSGKNQASLGGDLIGRQVVFPNGQAGVVVSHRPPLVFVYTDMDEFKETDEAVEILNTLASVSVPDNIKTVDCFGRFLDQSSSLAATDDAPQRAIFSPIPRVSDIALINTPMITGVTMFDALAPIGKGQNMLLIGSDVDDMRGYVCDILSTQRQRVKCIYAATEGDEKVKTMLQEAGFLDDIILVAEKSHETWDEVSKAAEATVVAATACAIAESFALEKGEDVFVVIDNIDRHKSLWDATTRVLVDVFGIDAVVKGDLSGSASSEMRAFFSSLIQRSAKFKARRGGGSVTLLLMASIPSMSSDGEDTVYKPEDFEGSPAKVRERIALLVNRNVPLTAGNLRKIQIPIPSASEGKRLLSLQHIDDLISMTDGQIWLDEKLKERGRYPPMDFQRSVTRIGIGADTESRADAPAIRRVVEGLRLDLSQAEHMDGADLGVNASVKQQQSALSWLLAMHQPPSSGSRLLSESTVLLLAASRGYLGESVDKGVVAGTKEGEDLVTDLLAHVKREAPNAIESIDSTLDFTDESRIEVESAINFTHGASREANRKVELSVLEASNSMTRQKHVLEKIFIATAITLKPVLSAPNDMGEPCNDELRALTFPSPEVGHINFTTVGKIRQA